MTTLLELLQSLCSLKVLLYDPESQWKKMRIYDCSSNDEIILELCWMFAILSSCCSVIIRVCKIWNVASLNDFFALLHLSCKTRTIQNNKHIFCIREKFFLSSSYSWNLHSNSMNLEILLWPWWQRLFLCWGKNV